MAQKTNVISVANEIVSRCSSLDLSVSLDLCVYLMDLQLLQISKDISLSTFDDDFTEKLIEKCVKDLREDGLSMKIIKLQLFWQKKYQTRDEIKKVHHERVFKTVLPIMSEIVDDNTFKGDKDRLYKKIVIFITMFAGLGSPTQPSIIKETQAALSSIFKANEIDNFVILPKATKEQQLVEFTRLITGILLFNKDCKKGGESLDDLPLILAEGVTATKERLLCFKDQFGQKIDHLVNSLLWYYSSNQHFNEVINLTKSENECNFPEDFDKGIIEEMKGLLIYYRQIEYCLIELIKDSEKSTAIIEELVARLQGTLLQVHNVVRYRVAVATVQVFPLFVQLSNVWVEMQEEIDILSEINNCFVDLSSAAELNLTIPTELTCTSDSILSFENEEINHSTDFYPGVKVCSISSISLQDNLQYKGFCAWTLAKTEGILITGNITIGVLHFSSRFYSFSSAQAARNWAVNPNLYIKSIIQVAKRRPELIKFLNLEQDILEKLSVEDEEKPTTSNAEVQTVLHPIEKDISKNYTFSEWELKRRAMKLATLTRCETKSQQTSDKSCFRTEMGIQVTPCKEVGIQTVRDRSCNHSLARKFVWSLKTDLFPPHLEQ